MPLSDEQWDRLCAELCIYTDSALYQGEMLRRLPIRKIADAAYELGREEALKEKADIAALERKLAAGVKLTSDESNRLGYARYRSQAAQEILTATLAQE